MNTDYKKQAQEFLTQTKTTLEVVEAKEQTTPLWAKKGEKHGIRYEVTLKNDRAKYVFDFWNSIANAEIVEMAQEINQLQSNESSRFYHVQDFLKKHDITLGRIDLMKHEVVKKVKQAIMPTAYDILACLSLLHEDNFEDFCSSFGYEPDSITALKTFDACREQDRQLRRLFSMEELELLTEIQ